MKVIPTSAIAIGLALLLFPACQSIAAEQSELRLWSNDESPYGGVISGGRTGADKPWVGPDKAKKKNNAKSGTEND